MTYEVHESVLFQPNFVVFDTSRGALAIFDTMEHADRFKRAMQKWESTKPKADKYPGHVKVEV